MELNNRIHLGNQEKWTTYDIYILFWWQQSKNQFLVFFYFEAKKYFFFQVSFSLNKVKCNKFWQLWQPIWSSGGLYKLRVFFLKRDEAMWSLVYKMREDGEWK